MNLQMDNYDGPELGALIEHLDIRKTNGNGQVESPFTFNLTSSTSIGPSSKALLIRPETAQGHLVNLKKLLNYDQISMPFASAPVVKSFGNEISPYSGLLRVREFPMVEIEHFVDPESGKTHSRFEEVQDLSLRF